MSITELFHNVLILLPAVQSSGADPGFSFRGAQKIICANAHYEREIRSPFRQGSRARYKGPGSSRQWRKSVLRGGGMIAIWR